MEAMEQDEVEDVGPTQASSTPTEEVPDTLIPIRVSKSGEEMVPNSGAVVHVHGCALNFPKNSFLKETEVKLKLTTDIQRWPAGYAAVAPLIDIISSGELQLPVAIRIRAWCYNGNRSKVKNAKVIALHSPSEDGGWEKLAEFPFGDEVVYELQCVSFSPIFLGVLEQHIVHAAMTAEAVIFQDEFNNYLIMLIPALHCLDEMTKRHEAGMRLLIQYSTVGIRMDDEVEIIIAPIKECFNFPLGGSMACKIDKKFLEMQVAHGRAISLKCDDNRDRLVEFSCDIRKNGKELQGTQRVNSYWKYFGETGQSPQLEASNRGDAS